MRINADLLRKIAPRAKPAIVAKVAPALADELPAYDIDTPLRVAHFLAQAAHECDGFRTLEEYASGAAYEGRKDLGNVKPGDGRRFKGRGIFQLTGRVNYAAYGKKLGIDLVDDPELAASPEVSVRVACEYWKAKGLNAWADRDNVREITRRINGGYNGLADRQACLARAKSALGEDAAPQRFAEADDDVPDAPIAADAPSSIFKSKTVGGASTVGVGEIADGISTAQGVLEQVKSSKDAAEQIGLLDYASALMSSPRFLFAVVAVAVCAGIIWWRWQHKRDHGI